MPSQPYDLVVIGGGAAGFFAAINAAELDAGLRIAILEKGSQVLSKVLVSGGGRCNVTNATFDPAQLVKFYPRGSAELRGPFTRFQPRDTMSWFEAHGVALKTEADGRVFPTTDSARTIIDCLAKAAENAGIQVQVRVPVEGIRRTAAWDGTRFEVVLRPGAEGRTPGDVLRAKKILLASGGDRGSLQLAQSLGHTVVPPVPSLFTFEIDDERIAELPGLTVDDVRVRLPAAGIEQGGPLLVTHWGMSGPAILKLSAWGARSLYETGYRAELAVNWLPGVSQEQARERLAAMRETAPRQRVTHYDPFKHLPQRLWRRLSFAAGVVDLKTWADVSKQQMQLLAHELTDGRFQILGKGEFKEEFVTCGGVELKEVNFKTMESRVCPGLYFAGEVLNIDALTGGFNFQNAWTTAWLAAGAVVGES
jgi:predicted Rossmann fold flavoprotein